MRTKTIRSNNVTYNTLITTALENGDLQKAESFMDDMIKCGFKPHPKLREDIDRLQASALEAPA